MKKIPLTKGQFAIVDDEDYFLLSLHTWYCMEGRHGNKRAMRSHRDELGMTTMVYMSRELMGCSLGDGVYVDHRNHNTLDNQRHNLRKCTPTQNNQNVRSRKGCASQYKGVHYDSGKKKRKQRWVVNIKHKNGTHRKRFVDEIEAAKHYDKMARQFFGEFACLNFPDN